MSRTGQIWQTCKGESTKCICKNHTIWCSLEWNNGTLCMARDGTQIQQSQPNLKFHIYQARMPFPCLVQTRTLYRYLRCYVHKIPCPIYLHFYRLNKRQSFLLLKGSSSLDHNEKFTLPRTIICIIDFSSDYFFLLGLNVTFTLSLAALLNVTKLPFKLH